MMNGSENMKINEQLLDKNAYYVIGVSGGCDSMFLLDTLRKKNYHLLVAHVNYNLRHDSYVDYELVSEYCAEYGIPFYYKEFHHDDYTDGNFQDRARTLRYTFYKEIYKLYKCKGVILGHHLDDNLETIYMQLKRHNTIHYLGIKEENEVQDMKVVRPLMHCYKKDILAYCQNHDIPYHDDYTNFETDFERDKVRNTVLNSYTIQQKDQLLQRAYQHNTRIKELEFKVQSYYQQYIADGQIYSGSNPFIPNPKNHENELSIDAAAGRCVGGLLGERYDRTAGRARNPATGMKRLTSFLMALVI